MIFLLGTVRNLQPLKREFEQLNNDLIATTKRLEAIHESLKRNPSQVLANEIQKLEEVIFGLKI